jgi:AcrR family transcriptional regulator
MIHKRSLLEDKKDWTKKALLTAAKKVFLEKGYANTTIEKIAAEARVSKGALYLYFQSKDDVYLTLLMPMEEEMGRLLLALEERVIGERSLSGKDVVMGFYDCFRKVYESDPDIFSIIRAFQIGVLTSKLDKLTAAEINRSAKRNSAVGRNIIDKAMERKLIREVNPAQLYNMLWGIFNGIVQLEESKYRATQKNYIFSTLEYAFSCLADHHAVRRKG